MNTKTDNPKRAIKILQLILYKIPFVYLPVLRDTKQFSFPSSNYSSFIRGFIVRVNALHGRETKNELCVENIAYGIKERERKRGWKRQWEATARGKVLGICTFQ